MFSYFFFLKLLRFIERLFFFIFLFFCSLTHVIHYFYEDPTNLGPFDYAFILYVMSFFLLVLVAIYLNNIFTREEIPGSLSPVSFYCIKVKKKNDVIDEDSYKVIVSKDSISIILKDLYYFFYSFVFILSFLTFVSFFFYGFLFMFDGLEEIPKTFWFTSYQVFMFNLLIPTFFGLIIYFFFKFFLTFKSENITWLFLITSSAVTILLSSLLSLLDRVSFLLNSIKSRNFHFRVFFKDFYLKIKNENLYCSYSKAFSNFVQGYVKASMMYDIFSLVATIISIFIIILTINTILIKSLIAIQKPTNIRAMSLCITLELYNIIFGLAILSVLVSFFLFFLSLIGKYFFLTFFINFVAFNIIFLPKNQP